MGGEAAYVKGRFSVQGEFIDSLVRANNGELLDFYGFYATADSYYRREPPIRPQTGYFTELIPLRNFDFGKGGA